MEYGDNIINDAKTTALKSNDIPHCARLGAVKALLVGGGRGGIAIIEVFKHYDWLWLDAVVDIDEHALGMQIARSMDIPTFSNAAEIVPRFDGDLIIDVTGDPALTPALLEMRMRPSIDIISGKAAKLLYDLVRDQIQHQERIQQKAMQLELFKAMLSISKRLESTSEQKSLLDHGIQSSAQLIVAHKGLAIDCSTPQANIVGGIGFDRLPLGIEQGIVNKLVAKVRGSTGQTGVEIPEKLRLPEIDGDFELVVPVYLDGILCSLMLFQIPLPVNDATREMLDTLVSHLELALVAQKRFKSLEEMAYRDPLTQLYNRRYFDERLEEELARTRRLQGSDLALMFMDLDHFKELNDTLGHAIGDKVLKKIANSLRDRFRVYDVLARYGGDEFVAIMPGVNEKTLDIICDRLLKSFHETRIEELEGSEAAPQLGLSIGACLVRAGADVRASELIHRADDALYRAKQDGRGKVKKDIII